MKDRGRGDWEEDVCSYWMFLEKTEGTRIPTSVVAPSKGWVCGRSAAGIAGLNPAGVHGCMPL